MRTAVRVTAFVGAICSLSSFASMAACSPSGATEKVTPAKQELAARFARAYFPEDTLNTAAVRSFEASTTAQFQAQPSAMALEQKAPGTIAAAVAAGRPFAIERQTRITRETQQKEADLFASRLSEADLRELVEIFESRATASLLKKGATGAADAGANSTPEGRIRAASNEAQRSADGSGTAQLAKFMESKASDHLAAIFPEMKAIALEVQSHVDPELDRRSQEAMRRAAADHAAKLGVTLAK